MGKIRGTHVSPGVYDKFTDLNYAAKTLGITTCGLAGETVKGPAFEPIMVADWSEYQTYFGGTSAEIYEDSKYPRYELPYMAKEYLKASDQLVVCRVLGLSGYNAGPAWAIMAQNDEDGEKYVVAIIRARGEYDKYSKEGDVCNPVTKYDTLSFNCDELSIEPYTSVSVMTQCEGFGVSATTETEININSGNLGQFTLVAKKCGQKVNDDGTISREPIEVGRYPVSLNAGSKDYIYSVIGSNPTQGSAAIFVEELYDVYLQELIDTKKVDRISATIEKIPELAINPVSDPVSDFMTIPSNKLTRKNLGQSFLAIDNGCDENGLKFYTTDENGNFTDESALTLVSKGYIYIVKSSKDENGNKFYCYVQKKDSHGNPLQVGQVIAHGSCEEVKPYNNGVSTVDAVKVLTYDRFFHLDTDGEVAPSSNMSDYHDQFRCASTPWFISELKGDGKDLEVKKLFRLHTISDGTAANTEVKVSIANVRPDDGTFDLYVRDFNDSDGNPTILESYRNINLIPGTKNYLGLKVGTMDGRYETKSKYILAEIIENDMTENCVPCGFLGYPVRDYSSFGAVSPTLSYNRTYDEDINIKKQYFGLSDKNIDVDVLYYKGKNAYTEDYSYGYTAPFHLDSTLNKDVLDNLSVKVTVDGDENTADMVWDAVSPDYDVFSYTGSPIIGDEADMEGTLYEDVKARKFTAYFYGGFDGWDIYRKSRTNTDEFKANKYKGSITKSYGATFSKIDNGDILALKGNCITSDYYAFLAAYNQFEIPEQVVINLFATPGIDYVYNKLLVDEVLDMISEKRGDTLYLPTTPDKPWGASDARDEMFTAAEVSANLDDSGLDTYYATTTYPWIKYFDSDNNIYINLPATKDYLRNMANVDNKRYPWYAPAGLERGDVNCVKMHFFAKLEDEDNVYDNRINPLKTFSEDGVKIWGNKTLMIDELGNSPMNRVNTVRLMLYLRKLIRKAGLKLIFDPNDTTMKKDYEAILDPILAGIKNNRGITDYKIVVTQTKEMMDAHELQCKLWVKPTPTLEYIEIEYMVTPQGVEFED